MSGPAGEVRAVKPPSESVFLFPGNGPVMGFGFAAAGHPPRFPTGHAGTIDVPWTSIFTRQWRHRWPVDDRVIGDTEPPGATPASLRAGGAGGRQHAGDEDDGPDYGTGQRRDEGHRVFMSDDTQPRAERFHPARPRRSPRTSCRRASGRPKRRIQACRQPGEKRHRILVIVIRRSWPGQSAQACSSDVFPLPAGAEMIVTRFRTARPSVAGRS
jgi:hypothetical protein